VMNPLSPRFESPFPQDTLQHNERQDALQECTDRYERTERAPIALF
jgi:hypothetical protein